MKRYKSFKAIGGDTQPQTEEFFQPTATPITEIPLQDVPPHVQHQQFTSNAIRNHHRPNYDLRYTQQQHRQGIQHPGIQHPGMQHPGMHHQDMYHPYPPHSEPILQPHEYRRRVKYVDDEVEDECKVILKHIKACKKCKRKYGNKGINKYVTIIIALIVVIMVLLTKVIDNL